jgi:hypothetical protein
MTLTLWRGDTLIGELLPRSPEHQVSRRRPGTPPSLAAFLIRSQDAPPCESTWQIAPPLPGVGVQQRPIEPDVVADRHQRGARSHPSSGPVALHPMSPEEAQGVPVERQLTVHDASGQIYLPLQIYLLESRFEPEHYADALHDVPLNALVDGVVWTVLAVFGSTIDAPAT